MRKKDGFPFGTAKPLGEGSWFAGRMCESLRVGCYGCRCALVSVGGAGSFSFLFTLLSEKCVALLAFLGPFAHSSKSASKPALYTLE